MTRVTLTTANTPGAVAILQLHGDGVADVLQQLTGRANWVDRRAYLAGFADIDEGLAIRLSDNTAQLMPHGGPRVVQRLIEYLTRNLNCTYEPTPDPRELYPEAQSPIEADMLNTIAKATSPAAIDLLAAQPRLWRELHERGDINQQQREAIRERNRTYFKLLEPSTVAVIGPANAGKSTLTNALMGRAVSIVADLPGTTRDWVGGLVELTTPASPLTAVAVHWIDTPGIRNSDDRVEQTAIKIARSQIELAQLLIAIRDPSQEWPDPSVMPRDRFTKEKGRLREPHLWVVNKVDDASPPDERSGTSAEYPLEISAEHDVNVQHLQTLVINRLGLADLHESPWPFSRFLLAWSFDPPRYSLEDYLNG